MKLTDKCGLIIAGSRSITDYSVVRGSILDFTPHPSDIRDNYVIMTGGASGVDSLAEQFAVNNDIEYRTYPADWEAYGRAAGPMRNEQMAGIGSVLIAVWDGSSPGTKNMIEVALDNWLEVHVYQYPK